MEREWYRNSEGKYHLEREDWVRSGRGECGAWIPSPAFVAVMPRAELACARCMKAHDANFGRDASDYRIASKLENGPVADKGE